MTRHSIGMCAALVTSVALPGMALAQQAVPDCAALAALSLPAVEIFRAEMQAAGPLPPDENSALTGGATTAIEVGQHCLIEGEIEDREGVGGNYGIQFQMRAPTEWNGRFLFQGGGGMDGFIAPAIGPNPFKGLTAAPALGRGYAVISMDGGHQGRDASFAVDQQARLDLAYASIGEVTDVAKRIIDSLYGRPPEHSVFMGCSNGGREAMMAAQRYPTEFDGIVAGNPGFHLSAASLAQAWDVQHLMSIAPETAGTPILSRSLMQDDLDLVSRAVLEACDGIDGIEDGLINAYGSCNFDLETLRGDLPDDKLDALKAVFAGPVNSEGEALYSDWPVDAGINTPGWRMWKLGTSETAQSDALNVIIGSDSLPRLFMTPPRMDFDVMDVDFDRAAEDVAQMGALNDATLTYLSTFAARGGKMVIVHGMSDPVFSANDIMRWYEAATEDTGGDFARLFMVPGLTHCGGGHALDEFDPLSALEEWIETGNAPEQIAATGAQFPGITQPLCAYPREAHYEGGEPSRIESYSCR